MMQGDLIALEDLAALKLAVRVLTAVIGHHRPDSRDVEELYRFAPLLANLPIDELACEVVHRELKRREEMHRRAAKTW